MEFTRAFLAKPRRFELARVNEEPKADEILLKVEACGLCSWELNFWRGCLNYFGYPHPLGHEYAGTVAELGSAVKNFAIGDKVTGLALFGGFSEYLVVPAAKCFKLDPAIETKHALAEPLKCVVTVLRSTAAEVGDNGVILGCGPMGLWAIQGLAGNSLASLVAVDIDDRKLAFAKKYGATHTINSRREDVVERLEEITDGRLADFVIEGTGKPDLLNVGQRYLKSSGRGKLVLMSSHEEPCDEFDFREAISRALQIIVPHAKYSYDQAEDFRRAVAFLNKGTFRVKELVTHEFRLADIQKAFETLERKPDGYMKGIVLP